MPELIATHRSPRLDSWLAEQWPDLSRARWQALIKEQKVSVNGKIQKANHTVQAGDRIVFEIPAPINANVAAENIPLDVLYEDADMVVINKPAGLVVHPAPGHAAGTLVNALLHHCKDLAGIGGELRPGIVHRLDKDTSGVMVIAKNEMAMRNLVDQFKNRAIKKEYIALVWGCPRPERGTIKTLIGRSENNRKKMSAKVKRGREAITHYEVVEKLGPLSLLRVRIETGRTHQIRVHMSFKGYPIVGDLVYGRARQQKLPTEVDRQMLHAATIRFTHPTTGKPLEFSAPLPPDMSAVCEALRK